MKKIVKLSLVTAITLASTLYASELKEVSSPVDMFKNAQVSGNIRSIYSNYNNDNDVNSYATAVGGQLKYELAKYKGFNGAVSFITSHDMNFASGDRDEGKRTDELSSAKGFYTEAIEAYINYNFDDLNLRAGRQLIDTPLADSDDARMVPNTFEAYIATYEMNGFSLMAGHLNRWQGVDAGLDDHWIKTGKDGVNFGGITYSNDFVETSAWYYNITGSENGNNALYVDAIGNYTFNEIELHAGVQYLNESELDKSGIEANIYGVMAEASTNGFDFTLAYNTSSKEKGKKSFSGYGGGTLFTNMTMIIDEITEDRDAQAVVATASYELDTLTFSYSYGDFEGDADSVGTKAHVIEQNIFVEYSLSDDITASAIYVIDDNKDDVTSTDFNDKNFRVLVSYNF